MRRNPLALLSFITHAILLIALAAHAAGAQTNPPANPQTNPPASPQASPQASPRPVGRTDPLGNPVELSTLGHKTDSPVAAAGRPVKYERDGIQVEFSVEPLSKARGKGPALVSGTDARATFRVSYAATGQPVSGLHPAAWFNSNATGRAPSEEECKNKVRNFLGGLLSVRPDIDLNSYALLTLNHDNTITFINPQISFTKTKLEGVVVLPGAGADWALSKDKNTLYVSVPDQSSVALVDTATRSLVGTIPTGEKTRPTRVYLQPDGEYVWVGLDGSPAVAVIDTNTRKLVATVPVGQGLHSIAFSDDSRWAYVTNSSADTVSAVDVSTLKKVADIATGKTPGPVAYSSASRFFYVGAVNDKSLSVIDPAARRVVSTVPAGRGVVAMRFEPSGRYGLAVSQAESKVTAFDSATGSVVGSTQVTKEPDQLAFTDKYAYVRGTGSEQFSMLDLTAVRKGKLAPMNIQAGRLAPNALASEIGVADMIAATPEGNSVMIANAPDQMIYYYVEGMGAPIGTLDNYKRKARGLMLIDRSLAEVAPGVYSTPLKLTKSGRFDVPMIIEQPRLVNCFSVDVAAAPGEEKAPPPTAVEALFKEKSFEPGTTNALRFKVTDPDTRRPVSGLKDVLVMVFDSPGTWQQRQFAKEVGDGVYEVTQVFPRASYYTVTVGIGSRGVRFSRPTASTVTVMKGTQPVEKTSAQK